MNIIYMIAGNFVLFLAVSGFCLLILAINLFHWHTKALAKARAENPSESNQANNKPAKAAPTLAPVPTVTIAPVATIAPETVPATPVAASEESFDWSIYDAPAYLRLKPRKVC